MSRALKLTAIGGAVLVAAFLGLRTLRDTKESTDDWKDEFRAYVSHVKLEERFAEVQVWNEAPPEVKSRWRAAKAARIRVLQGQAFVGDVHLPKDEIREFLDLKIASGEIDYVVVFPSRGAKWGEIVSIVDECRKSRVKIVLLNEHEV